MNTRSFLMAGLRGYKRFISPMLPPACRFEPSCSEYALEAVELHGAWRGSRMAVMRLLRCHPFSRGGFDPVPVPDTTPDDCNHAERSRLQAD